MAVAVLACSTGALATEPPPPNPGRPSIPQRHQHFNLPPEIKPAELPFQDPAVGEALLRFDAATRRLADATWARRADAAYPYLHWNSGTGGYWQTYQAQWRSATQRVAISTELFHRPRAAYGFELAASSTRPGQWRASLGYGLRNGKGGRWQTFGLAFFHPQLWPSDTAEPTPGLVVAPYAPTFTAHRKDKRFDYRLLVASRDNMATLENEDITRYLTSADSFRRAALDELDRLEKQVQVHIPGGFKWEIRKQASSGGEPPELVAIGEPPPAAIQQDVLAQATKDIGRRKKLVEDHFVELHRAAVAAFPPLLELLTAADPRSETKNAGPGIR